MKAYLQRRIDIMGRPMEQYSEEEIRALVSEEEAKRAVVVDESMEVQDPSLIERTPETAPGPFWDIPRDPRTPEEQKIAAQIFSEYMGEGDVPQLSRLIPDPRTGEVETWEAYLQRRAAMMGRPMEQYPVPLRRDEEVRALVSEEEAARAVDVVTGMTAEGRPIRSLQIQDQPYLDEPTPATLPETFEESWFSKLSLNERVKKSKELQSIVKAFEGFSAEDKIRMIRWAKEAGLTAVDFGNLLRANMASVDMSYLRQQVMLIPGNPEAFAKSFPRAVRAMWTDDYALNKELARKKTSLYQNYYSKGADFLRELGTPESNAWALEEQFIGLAGDRPLQKLARKLPWLNISNRAFVTGTNEMNWSIYEGHLRTLIHHNEQWEAGHLAGQPVEYADLRTPSYWPFTGLSGIKGKKLSEGDIQRSMNNVAEMLAEMSARGPMGLSWKKQ